jgi:hypothetical protein
MDTKGGRQFIYIYIVLVIGTSKHKLSFMRKQLNLHHNFVHVVQSKRKYLADGNDNIADQASKTSAVLPAQSADPIIAMLKFSVCNSICDNETADTAPVLMIDD